MSLRQKTLLIIGVAVIGLFLLLIVFSQTVLLQSYVQLETREMRQNAWRVINAIQDELQILQVQNIDWAQWDDTYHFVRGENDEFPDANLDNFVFVSNNVNVMLFVDNQGNLVYGKAVNLQTEREIIVPRQLADYLTPNSPLLMFDNEGPLNGEGISGIVMVASTPMMISAVPILPSSREGNSAGVLLWGRLINSEAIDRIEQQLRFDLTLSSVTPSGMPDDFQTAMSLINHEMPIVVQVIDSETVASYMLFYDIYNNPAFVLRLQMPREIYAQGQDSVYYLTLFLIGTCALLTVAMLLLLQKAVISRLERLNANVSTIRDTNEWTGHVLLHGNDELGRLALSINQMLDAVTQSREQAQQARGEAEMRERILKTFGHDVRTPLAAIARYAEMLQRGLYGEITIRQSEAALSIYGSAKQLIRFMDNLLEEAQLTAGKLQLHERHFAPKALLKEVETLTMPLAQNKNLTLNLETTPDLPDVLYGDYERLIQILINLITNSIKYTEKGEINVKLSTCDEQHWCVEVADTGLGIAPDALKSIFEPFWQVDDTTTRRELMGVGLGLSIVKQLAELMSGKLEVSSTVGQGSVFTLTLPLVKVTQPTPAAVV